MVKKIIEKKKSQKEPRVDYPVGDFLIRLKNAARVGNIEFDAINTNLTRLVAETLVENNFLESFEVDGRKITARLKVHKKKPLLMNLKLISKPGLRIYMSKEELETRFGPSILIVSTNKGIMTDKKAVKENVGGEVIAELL